MQNYPMNYKSKLYSKELWLEAPLQEHDPEIKSNFSHIITLGSKHPNTRNCSKLCGEIIMLNEMINDDLPQSYYMRTCRLRHEAFLEDFSCYLEVLLTFNFTLRWTVLQLWAKILVLRGEVTLNYPLRRGSAASVVRVRLVWNISAFCEEYRKGERILSLLILLNTYPRIQQKEKGDYHSFYHYQYLIYPHTVTI